MVKVSRIIEDQEPPKRVYNPDHPDADKNGLVAMPNVNQMEEMVNMLSASRAYEANASVLNASREMALKALNIGNR